MVQRNLHEIKTSDLFMALFYVLQQKKIKHIKMFQAYVTYFLPQLCFHFSPSYNLQIYIYLYIFNHIYFIKNYNVLRSPASISFEHYINKKVIRRSCFSVMRISKGMFQIESTVETTAMFPNVSLYKEKLQFIEAYSMPITQ